MIDIKGIVFSRLHEYLGVWAMHEKSFLGAVDNAAKMDIRQHVAQGIKAGAVYDRDGNLIGYEPDMFEGVASLDVAGTLMKHTSSMSDGTSTVLMRRAIRQAASNPAVKAIVLRIDSPGGTVAGTRELAEEIAAAAAKKPVHANIEDLGASAAYWVASQATKIWANATALVGSIGTYGVLYDASEMARREGLKVHVVRAGAFKGMGTLGTEITEEQLADYQRVVNELNAFFVAAVAKGRGMDEAAVASIADGRVHVGEKAREIGLIDGVRQYDDLLRELAGVTNTPKGEKRGGTMSGNNPSAPVATLAEIKQACSGASADFVLAQLEKGATVEQAKDAWIAHQNQQIEALKATAKAPGVPALPTNPSAASAPAANAIEAYTEALAEKRALGMSERAAKRAIAAENRPLHDAFLAAWNSKHNKPSR